MKMLKYTHGGGQALLSSKQGVLKRALLYILMPVFCAVLCAGAVFLCQNNKVAAAAEESVSVEMQHGNAIFRYTSGTVGNTSNATTSIKYGSDFGYNGANATCNQNLTSLSYAVGTSSKDYYSKAAYENFSINVSVPAGQKVAIRFKFSMSATRTQTLSDCSARAGYELFHFGDKEDKSSELSFNVASKSNATPGSSSTYTLSRGNTSSSSVASVSGSKQLVITYDNKDGSNGSFENYFGYFAYAGGTANRHTYLEASMSLTYEILTTPVAVPTLAANLVSGGSVYSYEAEYTGQEQTFYLIGLDKSVMETRWESVIAEEVGDTDYTEVELTGGDVFWDDEVGGADSRRITIEIVKANPKVVVNKVVSCTKLPDAVPIDTEKSTAGTISWTDDATIDNPKWQFVPTDTKNYVSDTVYGLAQVEKKHTFDDDHHVEEVEATCTSGGNPEYWQCLVCEKYYTDSNGATEISSDKLTVAALGHNLTKVNAVAATCTADGVKEHYKCSRCNGLFTDSTGTTATTDAELKTDKLNHDWGDWETVTAATCTGKGSKKRVCKNDGSHFETDEIPATGHDYKVISGTQPTCTTGGSSTEKCSRCQDERINSSADPLGHDLEKVEAVSATCTAAGIKEHFKCKRCNKLFSDISGGSELSEEDTVAQALGHNFAADFTVDTAPTCTEEGSKSKHCSRCAEVSEVTVIEKTAHDYGAPSWDWNGYESSAATFTCTNCGGVHNETADITSEITKQATYSENGIKTYTAAVVFNDTEYTDTKTETIPKLAKEENGILEFEQEDWYYGSPKEPKARSVYGTVVFSYSTAADGVYSSEKPEDVGVYYIKASVDEGESWLGTEAVLEFEILQADNEIISLTLENWDAGAEAGVPQTEAKFGADTVFYTYGTSENGEFTVTVPTEAGTYFVKAVIAETPNYKGAEKIASFTITKTADDPNGSVGDLDPDKDYDFEINVKESDALYNIAGENKGYIVELWIMEGDERGEYYKKTVTLTLAIPEGMEEFTLYRLDGVKLTEISGDEYSVNGRLLTIRTELPVELVFNKAPEEPVVAGVPWWVWLLVGLGGAAVLISLIIIIVVASKKGVDAVVDNGEVLKKLEVQNRKLEAQDKKLDELIDITDGGFNDIVDENSIWQ